jgi:hypothetical protein
MSTMLCHPFRFSGCSRRQFFPVFNVNQPPSVFDAEAAIATAMIAHALLKE